MKLVKSHDENKQVRYALFSQPSEILNEERLKSAVKREVLKIQIVQFMIVVLTEKDGADVVTNWLDEAAYPEVAATMAKKSKWTKVSRWKVDCRHWA